MIQINFIYSRVRRGARRCAWLLIALNWSIAEAQGPCQNALSAGERITDSLVAAVDAQTLDDLEINGIEQMLAPYLHTDFGRRRWAHVLRHPDLTNVSERQNLVRYLADHLDQFESLTKHLTKIGGAEKHILEQFLKLEKNNETMAYDVIWTIYVWACYIGPALGHYFFDLPAYASFLIAGQAWGTSMGNVKRVRKDRDLLGLYQIHLESADLGHAPLAQVPNPIARELAAVLDPHPEPPARGLRQNVLRLYDRLLDSVFNRGSNSFASVRRRLRRMEPIVGTTIFGVPLTYDISLIWDRFFISNYRLRDLHAKVVDHKEEMATLFSALGEFEMFLALARFYNAHREQTTFLEIKIGQARPHFEARQARAPLMAQHDYANTVPNNLSLSGKAAPIEVLVGEAHQGASTRAKLFGQLSLMTLAGMPVFAEGGSTTPNLVVAQLSAVRVPYGVTPLQAEATRWAELQKISSSTPNALVLLHEPFAFASEDQQLALRSQMLSELSDHHTLAVMVTRTRALANAVEDWPSIARRQMADYRAIAYQAHDRYPSAPNSFQGLLEAGVAPEFVREAELNLMQIERGGRMRRWRQNVIPLRAVLKPIAPAHPGRRKIDTHRQ